MNQYDATELAYKRGFEDGKKSAAADVTKLAKKNRKLVHANAKLMRTERAERQENAELRDQVYNLTLYLREAFKHLDDMNAQIMLCDVDDLIPYNELFELDYDGMPGYNPEILEVQK